MPRPVTPALLAVLLVLASPLSAQKPPPPQTVSPSTQIVDWDYSSTTPYNNPFRDVTLDALITGPDGQTYKLPAFWDGGLRWRFRFCPPAPGRYTFRTTCSDPANPDLHDRAGTIDAAPYTGTNPLLKHGPLKISADKRHFAHADGTPFLWLADSWWHGMTTRLPWPDGFQTLARDRAQKGFSVIQFAIAFPCDIAPFDPRGANEAGHAWDPDFHSINPDYFQLTDKRIQFLVDQGLVPSIVGAWGYYLTDIGLENARLHWRYLIARYGAYPVSWTVCGEAKMPYYTSSDPQADTASQRQGWSQVAAYIKATDPYNHPLTVHPGTTGGSKIAPLTDMAPLDFIQLMAGHTEDSARAEALPLLQSALESYDKPILFGEIAFEGMHGGECGPKVQRQLFWTAMLNGAGGHSYGADAIWQFNTRQAPFGPSPGGSTWGNRPWEDAMHWEGATHLGIGRQFLNTLPWSQLVPHPEWIQDPANTGKPLPPLAAGIPGQLRLFYFPTSLPRWGKPHIVRDLDPGRPYLATFISPIDGSTHPLGHIQADDQGRWPVPPGPILQDWLLTLTTP